MKKDILWRRRRITVNVGNKQIEADIVWWAKDYFVEIIKPMKKTLPGKHMMYMIPTKFVFDQEEADLVKGPAVPILESCKQMIANEYS